MAEFLFHWVGGVGMLDFSGDFTSGRVEKLRHGLIVSLENADCVVVNLRQVTGLDADCFRLLCSAHRAFTGRNKKLFLVGLRQQAFPAGEETVLRQRAACSEPHESCLWHGIADFRGREGHAKGGPPPARAEAQELSGR